jgi:signal transduction histidine kinase
VKECSVIRKPAGAEVGNRVLTLPRTLRSQLLLVLAAAIAPLAALAIYLASDEGRRDSEDAQQDARAAVRLVTQDLNRLIQASRDLILGFSRNLIIQDHPETCTAILTALRPSFPQFANIGMVDRDRQLVCSAVPTKARLIDDSEGLGERVLKSRDIAVGEFRIGLARPRPVLPVAGPVFDREDQIKYLFFVTIDLRWLGQRVALVPLQKQAILLVLDRRGTVIAGNPDTAESIGKPAPADEQTLLRRGDFNGEVTGADGVRRVYSVARAGAGDGLSVILKIRAADIYQPSRRRLLLHLGGLSIVGLLVLGVTWTGLDREFARPLLRLVETSRRLGAGDPSSRCQVPYTGEIGALARSFDQMADALQLEQTRTFKASKTFRSIIEGTAAATGEEFFRSLARSLASALGAKFAMVGELTEDLQSVQTIALCANGQMIGNIVYPLQGTPCEGVVNRKACYYPSGVQELFPQDQMLHDLDVHSYLGAPLIGSDGRILGLITVLHERPMAEEFIEAESILTVFAARAAVELERLRAERALKLAAAENELMVSKLRALTARLESVREEERTHVAREIHDELGQQLTAIRFDLTNLKRDVKDNSSEPDSSEPTEPRLVARQLWSGPKSRPELQDKLTALTALVDSTIRTVRRIATELRPSVLDTFGLVAAIEWQADDFQKRTKIHCDYEGPQDLKVNQELSTTVFRICQEALTNVARHSAATEVTIRLTVDGDWLSLEVRDNGKGISPEALAQTRSLGVLGMRERARIAGGEFEIGGRPGEGATIRARLPLRPRADATAGGPAL